jgi:hypothetical protein
MAEDPEQVLPQQRVAAPSDIEERPVECPLHLEEEVAGDQRRKGEKDHRADHQDIPAIGWRQVDMHSRRPAFEDTDDQFHGRGD